MALASITYMSLPDVPPIEHTGHYEYLMRLKRVNEIMAGREEHDNRVLTIGDLKTAGLLNDSDLAVVGTPKWNDLRFPATGFRLDSASTRYSFDYTNCGVNFHDNSRYTEEPLCAVAQLPHSRKFGTTLRPHVHWEQNQNDAPNWLLEWRWVNNGEVRGTYAQAIAGSPIYTYTSGNVQQVSEFPEISSIFNEDVSSMLDIRIFRDTANASGLFSGADTYTGNALLKEFDIHYQIDGFGSTTELTK